MNSFRISAAVILISTGVFSFPVIAQEEELSIVEVQRKEKELGRRFVKLLDSIPPESRKSNPELMELGKEMRKVREQLNDFRFFSIKRLEESVLIRRPYYMRFDRILRNLIGGLSDRLFLRDDNLKHQLFYFEQLGEKLKIEESVREQFRESATALEKSWSTSLQSAINSQEDETRFENYRAELREFDRLLDSKLSPSKRKVLDSILVRNKWNELGIPTQLSLASEDLGLTTTMVKEISKILKTEAIKISLNGKKRIVDSVNRLFPGYIEPAKEIASKPFEISIGMWLQVLDYDYKNSKNKFEDCLSKYPVKLESGMYIFPSLSLRAYGGNVWAISEAFRSAWVPSHGNLGTFGGSNIGDLSDEQLLFYNQVANGEYKKSHPRSSGLNGLFSYAKQYNQDLEATFLKSQLADYRNRLRILAILSLGPEAIQKHANFSGKLKNSEFKRELKKVREEFEEFVHESEEQIFQLLTDEVNLRSDKNIKADYFGEPCFVGIDKQIKALRSVIGVARKSTSRPKSKK